jgi:enediyne biosynthesis protein E4
MRVSRSVSRLLVAVVLVVFLAAPGMATSSYPSAVVKQIPITGGVPDMAFSPDGRVLYAVDEREDSLLAIDALADTVINAVWLGNGAPRGIAVTSDGQYVYVGDVIVGSTKVTRVSLKTDGSLDTATTLSVSGTSRPIDFAIAQDKLFIVNNYGGGVSYVALSTINSATSSVTPDGNIGTGNEPVQAEVDRTGQYVFVVNYRGNNVVVIDAQTNQNIGAFSVSSFPDGLRADPDLDRVYVTAVGTDGVTAWDVSYADPGSSTQDYSIPIPDPSNGSDVLKAGSDKFLYVGSRASGTNKVYVIDDGTGTIIDSLATADGPTWIRVSPLTDRVYVAHNPAGEGISVIDYAPVLPTFADVASGAGVAETSNGIGAAWGDYDGDGDLDLYLANMRSPGSTNKLYRNNGPATFTFSEVGNSAGVDDAEDGGSAAWGDYDNDGDLDLYLANTDNDPNRLYRNEGNGTFSEIGSSANVDDSNTNNASVWGDYDGDGDLDLYVATFGNNRLYRYDGNDIFTEVGADAGVDQSETGYGAAWGDYDGDGDLDLYVTGATNKRYRNEGNGDFTEVFSESGNATGVAWGDYDGDGDLDLYVAEGSSGNKLYRYDGGESFVEVGAYAGVNDGGNGHAVVWGDFDNDGRLDLYLTNYTNRVNRLYWNEGDGTFDEVGAALGVDDSSTKTRGASWGDYDGDGDLDLYVVNGDGSPNRLFKNGGNAHHWLHVETWGTTTNRDGIGAVVRAVADGKSQRRDVSSGTAIQSQSSIPVEFGLRNADVVDSLVIRWPSTIEQVVMNVAVDDTLTVVEPLKVELPDTVATYDSSLEVPVRIARTDDLGIVSAELFVSYDGDLLTAFSPGVSTTALTSGWTVETNVADGVGTSIDTLKIAMADEVALAGSGDLLLLDFTVADRRSPAYSDLKLEHVLLNDGDPESTAEDGSVALVGVDGSIASAPDQIIPRWPIQISVAEADENRNDQVIDSLRAEAASGGQTETVVLIETAVNSGEFSGSIATVFSNSFSSDDAVLQAMAGDVIEFCYDDSLDGAGISVSRCATTDVVGGTDGLLRTTIVAQAGDTVRVRVTDGDLVDMVTVPVTDSRTSETEPILLSAFSPGNSVFFGRVFTAAQGSGAGDSTLQVARYDTLTTTYADTLTAMGGTATLTDATYITRFGDCDGDGQLIAFDAAKVLFHILLHPDPPVIDTLACNVDEFAPIEPITPFDASLILQKRVGLIDRFPIQLPCSANHPQSETCNSVPKLIPQPDERVLALQEGDGYLSVWAEDRTGIVSGELLITGIKGEAILGEELGEFLVAAQHTEGGLHVVFAGPQSVSGAGELLRIYSGTGSAEGQLARAVFNDGRIVARVEGVDVAVRVPTAFALHPNVPNPFNPETAIRFDLPQESQVQLDLFDVLGQRVKRLVAERLPAGAHRVVWDGRDEASRLVGSGIYFYRLQAANGRSEASGPAELRFTRMRRMMLLK